MSVIIDATLEDMKELLSCLGEVDTSTCKAILQEWIAFAEAVPEEEERGSVDALIRPWFESRYPEQPWAAEIKAEATFSTALNAATDNEAFYQATGIENSLVMREVLEEAAWRDHTSYAEVIHGWGGTLC